MEQKNLVMMRKPIKLRKEIYNNDIGDVVNKFFFEAIISNTTIDRGNDIMVMAGCDYKNYMGNPIIKLNHESEVGHNIGRTETLDIQNDKIIAKGYIVLNLSIEDDRNLAHKLDEGLVNAVSIGFIPLETEYDNIGNRIIKKWELLEFSIVDIPMNGTANIIKNFTNNNKNMEEIEIKQEETKTEEKTFDFEKLLTEFGEVKTLLNKLLEAKRLELEKENKDLKESLEAKRLELEKENKDLKESLEAKSILETKSQAIYGNFKNEGIETKSNENEELKRLVPLSLKI